MADSFGLITLGTCLLIMSHDDKRLVTFVRVDPAQGNASSFQHLHRNNNSSLQFNDK